MGVAIQSLKKEFYQGPLFRESEDCFRDIFDAVNDGIFIVDPSCGQIKETNPIAAEMLGYSQAELEGKSVAEIHPTEMEQLNVTLKEVLQGYPVVTDEFSCLRKDNKSLPVEMSFSTLRLRGTTYVMAMIRDISERKEAEKALKKALGEVKSLKNRLQAENVYLRHEIMSEHDFNEITGNSKALNNVLSKVEQVAPTTATVLIQGETGVGKELIARAIHNRSDRKKRTLIKVNCAALPANLIESELFGHEAGAFTGATSRRQGRFELADGGTIFLDEIGDLPLELQAKLLRVLQEKEFERLGSSKTIKVDVRVIVATNRTLEKAVSDGEFREDLYYRLNVFPIHCPSLRERKEDIPMLANHFVKLYSSKFNKQITRIPDNVTEALQAYSWPGNIRELENIIERAVITSNDNCLKLPEQLKTNSILAKKCETEPVTLEEMEKQLISKAMDECNFVVEGKNGAAQKLGMPPSTLRLRIKKYGISRSA